MKSLIKKVMDKQGISKSELSRQTGIYKIKENFSGKRCNLSERETNLLKNIANKPSCKINNKKEAAVLNIKGKNFINVLACLPTKTRKGDSLYVKKDPDNLVVWYQPKTRGKSEFIFKKYIPLSESFITCLGLSIGDGLNNPSIQNNHYTFASINFELTHLMLDWLESNFAFNSKNLQLSMRISIEEKILKVTDIEKRLGYKIAVYKCSRCKSKILVIQVCNAIFQCLYLSLFNKLKKTILNNLPLRRAFLKGLFAAEGHVKHSVYGTLESISFSFNPASEKELMFFVKKCLEKEKIYPLKMKEGELYFCGYENMIRFYLIGAIALHKEKKKKFLRLLKNAKINVYFKPSYLMPLKKYSQHELAELLGCTQSSLCSALKKTSLALNYLPDLDAILDVSSQTLIQNVEFVKVSKTSIKDKESISFLLFFYLKEKLVI